MNILKIKKIFLLIIIKILKDELLVQNDFKMINIYLYSNNNRLKIQKIYFMKFIKNLEILMKN